VMAVLGLGLMASACRGPAPSPDAASDQASSSAEAGYVTPPQVTSVTRTANGLALSGRADANARVRLSALDGVAYGATANANGDWMITAPTPQQVRLFTLSEVLGSRDVPGGGFLAVFPAPGRTAAILRVGGPSQALSDVQGAPQVTAVDYDSGGGAVVSGLAKPGAPVRLTVDGTVAGEVKPDADGRYSVSLAGSLPMAAHEAVAQSTGGLRRTTFEAGAQSSLAGGVPFHGGRIASGWRVDWSTPGGSEQTTLVLDPPADAAKP